MKVPSFKETLKKYPLRIYCGVTVFLLFAAAFYFDTPQGIMQGMVKIIVSRDALITDYFELAGLGASFFNAAVVSVICMLLIGLNKIPYTGLTLAAFYINAGFAFWGKNPVNIMPIILGVWLYAKLQGIPFARYIYNALFATCLGPFVTEMVYLLPFETKYNIMAAFALGVFIGFAISPLATHTASMHMGYSLFNVGYAAGILAFVMFCVLKSYGIETEPVFIWKEGVDEVVLKASILYFAITFIIGVLMQNGNAEGLLKIMRHPGRAVADFVMMDGPGTTLMNMGAMGLLAEVYIIVIKADLNGPTLGCILTVFGFAAFGAHLRNYIPVLLGVVLSTYFTKYDLTSPAIIIASLFVVGISPIAGQFGPIVGILAGMLHAAIVTCTSALYGGLNLYNNGFSAGWVAIIMIPLTESFMRHFEIHKKKHIELRLELKKIREVREHGRQNLKKHKEREK